MAYFLLWSLGIACSASQGQDQEAEPEESVSVLEPKNKDSWVGDVFSEDKILSIHVGQDIQDFVDSHAPTVIQEGAQYSMEGTFENGLPFSLFVTADGGSIYEMSIDLFPEDKNLLPLFDELRKHYDTLYHKSSPADGYATWKRPSRLGHLVEVSLADESMEMGRSTLMVNQLMYVDRKYED